MENCRGCGKLCGNCVKLRGIKGATGFVGCGKALSCGFWEMFMIPISAKGHVKKGKIILFCTLFSPRREDALGGTFWQKGSPYNPFQKLLKKGIFTDGSLVQILIYRIVQTIRRLDVFAHAQYNVVIPTEPIKASGVDLAERNKARGAICSRQTFYGCKVTFVLKSFAHTHPRRGLIAPAEIRSTRLCCLARDDNIMLHECKHIK